MKDYSHLHEEEVVSFCAPNPRPVAELLELFLAQGFTLHDDVLCLDRSNRGQPWQSSSIVAVEVSCRGKEIFGFEEGEWDEVKLKYLFAYLPFELTERFFVVIETTGRELGMGPQRNGKPTSIDALRADFQAFKTQLLAEVGDEPGSESAAIVIQYTYPRK